MKAWDELSGDAHEIMEYLGNCGPTVNTADRMVKGYDVTEDGNHKFYLTAAELRRYGAGLVEVADWLDARGTNNS